MYETEQEIEKVILVAVCSNPNQDPEESLDELEELVKTAGATVVGRMIQNLEHASSATYIGSGKVEELKEVDIDSDELVDIEKALEAEIANEVAKKIDEPVEELPKDNTITIDAEQINDSAENSAEEVNESEEIDAYDDSEIDFDDDDDDDDFEFIDLD